MFLCYNMSHCMLTGALSVKMEVPATLKLSASAHTIFTVTHALPVWKGSLDWLANHFLTLSVLFLRMPSTQEASRSGLPDTILERQTALQQMQHINANSGTLQRSVQS